MIDQESGCYLFPLPMTGDTPAHLRNLVFTPQLEPHGIYLEEAVAEQEQPQPAGLGFEVEKQMSATCSDGSTHNWSERWLVVRGKNFAEAQQKAILKRLCKAREELSKLKPKKNESLLDFRIRAQAILKKRDCEDLISPRVEETVTEKVKYHGRGRPHPTRSRELIETRNLTLHFTLEDAAIQQRKQLAGWRIYVSNVPLEQMSLQQSVRYYRNEWLVERGFHRFKQGSIPALPLFVRVPERIEGLMVLLTVALQAITLLEFVIGQSLAEQSECLAGLVPGNPKMKTSRPTAERILSQFSQLHLLVRQTDHQIKAYLIDSLNPLQLRILDLLHVPRSVCRFSFSQTKFNDSS